MCSLCEYCKRSFRTEHGKNTHLGVCPVAKKRPPDTFENFDAAHIVPVPEKFHRLPTRSGCRSERKKVTKQRNPCGVHTRFRKRQGGGGMHIEKTPQSELRSAIFAAISERAAKRFNKRVNKTERVEDGIKWKRQFDICCLCGRPAHYWTPRGKFCDKHREAAYDAMKKAKLERYAGT